ncbi:MAG: methyltransferase [Oscillospiraceae bacterium]|nr:methyltransferase [Oscillospiraceae bacterium]
MEKLYNGFTLDIPGEAFPLSTDSMALSGFVKLPRNARVLDLGAGAGTLGVLLCAKDAGCSVVGAERCPVSHAAAEKNILENGLQQRLKSLHCDIRQLQAHIAPGSFDCVVTNPPYFSGGPESLSHGPARREDNCSLADFVGQAARGLKYGGDFYIVYRPERLGELMGCCAAVKLEPKRLCLLRHKVGAPVTLVLLACRKGGKPGLLWEEVALQNADGSPTDYYKELYHLEEA